MNIVQNSDIRRVADATALYFLSIQYEWVTFVFYLNLTWFFSWTIELFVTSWFYGESYCNLKLINHSVEQLQKTLSEPS